MPSALDLRIHRSQFPAQVTADLVASLHQRKMAHKFHYDSQRQARKWLEIHEQYSPARTDANCLSVYENAFQQIAEKIPATSLHLLGLGCGGGQKDASLVQQLQAAGINPCYWPMDVSPALVLTSWLRVSEHIRKTGTSESIQPLGFVGDLASELDPVPELTGLLGPEQTRLITFFGMMPNFEPDQVMPRLGGLLRKDDWLLVSANLAPGPDYEEGVRRVLPLYDNSSTSEWLMLMLLDLGLEPDAGHLDWAIKSCPAHSDLLRVQADFTFDRSQILQAGDQSFAFESGDQFQMFYSYRHTPERLNQLLARHGMETVKHWVTASGEEGVFLCRRH